MDTATRPVFVKNLAQKQTSPYYMAMKTYYPVGMKSIDVINNDLIVWVADMGCEAFPHNENEVIIKGYNGYSRIFKIDELLTKIENIDSDQEMRDILKC